MPNTCAKQSSIGVQSSIRPPRGKAEKSSTLRPASSPSPSTSQNFVKRSTSSKKLLANQRPQNTLVVEGRNVRPCPSKEEPPLAAHPCLASLDFSVLAREFTNFSTCQVSIPDWTTRCLRAQRDESPLFRGRRDAPPNIRWKSSVV